MTAGFNPRTYIRYDLLVVLMGFLLTRFNPRTYIRYDSWALVLVVRLFCFNPRTYIRYDDYMDFISADNTVSIHVPI